MNKKGQIGLVLGVIALVIVLCIAIVAGMYNGLVNADVNVKAKWGNVQTAYQRRADLIPNLVDTVKGYKNYEQETLTKITELRSQAGQAQNDVKAAKTPAEIDAAGTEMSSVMSRLLVIVEAYPDLKASQNFLSLQDELSGTENRIKYERDNYNTAVQAYEVKTRSFPTSMLAGMFGFNFDRYKMFEAQAGAENAPKVNFNE
jgi:LemA protein